MGLFSWLRGNGSPAAKDSSGPATKASSDPATDRTTKWIREQIADRAKTGDAIALAEAAATLSGHGSMVFGMVIPASLPNPEQLRDAALEALRAQIPKLADRDCEPVFAVVARASLPVDITARRAKLAGAREVELAKMTTWLREQIQSRIRLGSVNELVDAAAALSVGGHHQMVFGMAIPADLRQREQLRDECIVAVRERIPTMSDAQCKYVYDVVRRANLPIDIADRHAELAAKRQDERARKLVRASGTEPQNPELERAIAANLENDANYLVLADWLQTQGHPRGALIALQLRAESDRSLHAAAVAHLAEHADALLGPLEPHTKVHDDSDRDAFAWRRGFIHGAYLSYDANLGVENEASLAEILELLLAHPSGRYLGELAFGINGDVNENTLDDLTAIFAARAPASLRALHLGDFVYQEETEMSWYQVGDLARLWAAVPRLRRLIVQGGSFQLGSIELPELEHAEFRTGGLSIESARAIANARWPKLRFLDVWYGDPNYGGDTTVAHVLPLLARRDLPALTHLGLKNAAHTDAICGELARAPLAAQLEDLDLSMGTMSDQGAERLVSAASALSRLVKLDVSSNYLSATAIAGLRQAFRNVLANDQNDAGDDDGERHPTVGE
ncbi:MAG: hypothetical protein JWO36_465 [Myxococcales bacterium]|nr:hypothetical protein [Myxococcales bacterium]